MAEARATRARRTRMILALAALGLFAVVLIIFFLPEPKKVPAWVGFSDGIQGSQDREPVVITPGFHANTDSDAPGSSSTLPEDKVDDPDIVFELTLPDGWAADVRCSLVSMARGKSGVEAEDAQETSRRRDIIALSAGSVQAIPLSAGEGGLGLRVTGAGVLSMIVELRWVNDKTLRYLTWSEVLEGGFATEREIQSSGFDSSDTHPTMVVWNDNVTRGDTARLQVTPLVPVIATFRDAGGVPFAPAPSDVDWTAMWHSALAGRFFSPRGIPGSAEPRWSVPVGSNLSVSPSYGGGKLALRPERFSGVVPPSREGLKLDFVAHDVEIARVRVLGRDNSPLPDAQFRLRPGMSYPPVVDQASRGEVGVYTLMLSKTHQTMEIWAPQYGVRTVPVSQVPRDGKVLDIRLERGMPVMLVRATVYGAPPDAAVTVRTNIRTRSDDTASSWPFVRELPENGELVILGQPPHTPYVELESESYDFTLVRSEIEAGVPVREFAGVRRIGIIVSLIDSADISWANDTAATVLVSRPPPSDDGGTRLGPTAADGETFYLKAGEQRKLKLAVGCWVVRAWQDNEKQAYGEMEVTVSTGFTDVSVAPSSIQEWRIFSIRDSTGRCSAKGTAFLVGIPTLAEMRNGARDARRLAEIVATGLDEENPKGHLALNAGCGSVAAHENGKVVLPTWVGLHVLVLPEDNLGVYEAHVDHSSATVVVQSPRWTGSVSFLPDSGAGVEDRARLSEQGWVVAIREYTDLRDLTTVQGMDFKIPATDGAATIPSMLPGTYVARYARLSITDTHDPATGRITGRSTNLEWLDAVRFEVQSSSTTVALPVTREK